MKPLSLRRVALLGALVAVPLTLLSAPPAQAAPPYFTGTASYVKDIEFDGPWGCNATDGDVIGNQHTSWHESWTVVTEPGPGLAVSGAALLGTLTGSVSFTVTSGCRFVNEEPNPNQLTYTGSFSGTTPAQLFIAEYDGKTAVSVAAYGTGIEGTTTATGGTLAPGDSEVTPGQYFPQTTQLVLGPDLTGSGFVAEPPYFGPYSVPTNMLSAGVEAVTVRGTLTAAVTRSDTTVPPATCEGVNVPAALAATPSAAFGSPSVAFTAQESLPGSTYLLDPGDGSAALALSPTTPTPYAYAKPGEYTATLLVTTPLGCTATSTQRFAADPVTTYAPTLHFHIKEKFFPATTGSFLDHSQLVQYVPKICGKSVYLAAGAAAKKVGGVKQPLLNPYRLSSSSTNAYTGSKYSDVVVQLPVHSPQPGALVKHVCTKTSGKVSVDGSPDARFVRRENDAHPNDSGFYLNLLDRPAWRSGPKPTTTSNAPVYVDYKPGRYVAYWFFYPYNEWRAGRAVEVHEGDWEHIVVRLTPTTNLARQVAHFQHLCGGQVTAWSKAVLEDGTHPTVYPALGGHASYAHGIPKTVAASTLADNCGLPTKRIVIGNDTIGNTGVTWQPWRATGMRQLADVTRQTWWGFGGSWGDRSDASVPVAQIDNYGPPAPGPQHADVPKGW